MYERISLYFPVKARVFLLVSHSPLNLKMADIGLYKKIIKKDNAHHERTIRSTETSRTKRNRTPLSWSIFRTDFLSSMRSRAFKEKTELLAHCLVLLWLHDCSNSAVRETTCSNAVWLICRIMRATCSVADRPVIRKAIMERLDSCWWFCLAKQSLQRDF